MFEQLLSWQMRLPAHKGKGRVERLLFWLAHGGYVRSVYGPMIRVRAGDATNRFMITGALDKDYRDVFDEVSTLESGDCFIDIGANAGLFSVIASQRIGADGLVVAFEPSLQIFNDLIANLQRNGCQPVLPFMAAISEETGIAGFDTGAPGHSGIAHLSSTGTVRVVTLSGHDLASLLTPLLRGRATLIKIDVEGHEGQVVRSLAPLLAEPHIRRVIVEIDPKNLADHGSSDTEVYQILAAAGFTPRRGLGSERHFNEIFARG